MSGGVGPTADGICLPNEEVAEEEQRAKLSADPLKKLTHLHGNDPSSPGVGHHFLSLRQLNALASVVVLSASGMVAAEDAAFALFSLLYVYFLSSAAFPPRNTSSPEPPVFGERNLMLFVHASLGALLGLVLPIAYILEGVLEGDKEGIKAAAPHVFLLSCQVFMEGVTFSPRFSLLVRAFVPVFYNAKRMFTLADWVHAEIGKAEDGAEHGSAWRLLVGRGLAFANLAFWAFNLFGFLLPVYLPRCFKIYYGNCKVNQA